MESPISYNIFKQMITTIILTLFILVSTYIFYNYYLKPTKIMRTYYQKLAKMGYNALLLPYNPFKHDLIQAINQGVRQGDAMKVFKFQRGKYDVIVTNSLNRPKLEFNHPDFIKDFYSVDKHYQYPKQKKVVDLITRASGRNQLSSSQGPQWKRKRNIFNKIFNFDFVKSQSRKISQLADKAIKQQQNLGKNIKQGQQIGYEGNTYIVKKDDNVVAYNIFELTTRIFSEVMMQIFLGGSNKQYIGDQPAGLYLSRLIQDSSKQIMRPVNYILGRKFLALGINQQQRQINKRLKEYKSWALQFVKKRINQITQKFQKNPQINLDSTPSDIIEGLIFANKKAKLQKLNIHQQSISEPQEIVDDFTSFFIAGIQTTATFTQMMIYYLSIYPHIQEKVRKQIDTYMKTDDYSFENMKNFTYIDMLQKQTTRYFGPGTQLFPRIACIDNYLNNLPILKGTQILIMHMGNHYSEKYYKDPKIFRPQRWQSECKDIPPFANGGFSAGARSCIGKHLAMLDSKIALVKFLKRYERIYMPKRQWKIGFTFSVYPEQFDVAMILNKGKEQERLEQKNERVEKKDKETIEL